MPPVSPRALTLAWFALTLCGATPAAAYVPEDDSLGGLAEETLTAPPATVEPDAPSFTPGEDMGVEEEMAPDDHSRGYEATSVPAPRATIEDIIYGSTSLPEAVARTRDDLLDAAATGDIEALRPIFDRQRVPPIVDPFEMVDDAVDSLRLQSGDPEGREILAILAELLEGGHVHIGEASTETYVWPYFAEVPLTSLKPPHYVELYRVLTAVDVEEMVRFGHYSFFRIGIAPDGRIRFFSAGQIE